MDLSNKLIATRKKAGLTQKQLADRAKLSVATIQGYEQKKYRPKIENLKKIAKVLNVSIDFFIEEYMTELDRESEIILSQGNVMNNVRTFFDDNAAEMLTAYTFLNETGKYEAFKRVYELTKIPEYRTDTPD